MWTRPARTMMPSEWIPIMPNASVSSPSWRPADRLYRAERIILWKLFLGTLRGQQEALICLEHFFPAFCPIVLSAFGGILSSSLESGINFLLDKARKKVKFTPINWAAPSPSTCLLQRIAIALWQGNARKMAPFLKGQPLSLLNLFHTHTLTSLIFSPTPTTTYTSRQLKNTSQSSRKKD